MKRETSSMAAGAALTAAFGICCLGFLGWLGATLGLAGLVAFNTSRWADLILIPGLLVTGAYTAIAYSRWRAARASRDSTEEKT